jgi:hypothetical protein
VNEQLPPVLTSSAVLHKPSTSLQQAVAPIGVIKSALRHGGSALVAQMGVDHVPERHIASPQEYPNLVREHSPKLAIGAMAPVLQSVPAPVTPVNVCPSGSFTTRSLNMHPESSPETVAAVGGSVGSGVGIMTASGFTMQEASSQVPPKHVATVHVDPSFENAHVPPLPILKATLRLHPVVSLVAPAGMTRSLSWHESSGTTAQVVEVHVPSGLQVTGLQT